MNFEYMTSSQIAALILGIVFSIIAVATTFLAFKYAKKLNSFIKAISMALVAPFLAMIAWLFLIFSFLDGFRKDEVLNIIISILIALFICCMIILIAKALYNKNKDKFIEEDEEETVDDNSLETIGDENEEATVQGEPLLITDIAKEETEDETNLNVENEDNVEEQASEEVEVSETEEDEILEEKEDTIPNTEDNVENEENDVVADENSEESNVNIVEEDDENSDDDDDDKEFQEFLDSLRKKIDMDEDDDSNK